MNSVLTPADWTVATLTRLEEKLDAILARGAERIAALEAPAEPVSEGRALASGWVRQRVGDKCTLYDSDDGFLCKRLGVYSSLGGDRACEAHAEALGVFAVPPVATEVPLPCPFCAAPAMLDRHGRLATCDNRECPMWLNWKTPAEWNRRAVPPVPEQGLPTESQCDDQADVDALAAWNDDLTALDISRHMSAKWKALAKRYKADVAYHMDSVRVLADEAERMKEAITEISKISKQRYETIEGLRDNVAWLRSEVARLESKCERLEKDCLEIGDVNAKRYATVEGLRAELEELSETVDVVRAERDAAVQAERARAAYWAHGAQESGAWELLSHIASGTPAAPSLAEPSSRSENRRDHEHAIGDRTFVCATCKREVSWDEGADDDYPDDCDTCANEKHAPAQPAPGRPTCEEPREPGDGFCECGLCLTDANHGH